MRYPRSTFWIVIAVSLWWEVDSCTKDTKSVGVCLHIYLERDYAAIEVDQGNGRQFAHERHENGPQLVSHCESLGEALNCFKENLKDCYSIHHFLEYQQLLDGLSKTHAWLCEEKYVRERFLVLLQSLKCIENIRMNSSTCSSRQLTQNIWQKILRLETDQSICSELKWQHSCLLRPGQMIHCGQQAVDIYNSMLSIFMESWCSNSSKTSHIPVMFSVFFILIIHFIAH
ncbi:uncharacterized protein [Hetaerina americana]|uniref:uncharacterized protein n=1 Tax=Hetaerina americana TaxID=62018 RepID=UPI003A7F1C28